MSTEYQIISKLFAWLVVIPLVAALGLAITFGIIWVLIQLWDAHPMFAYVTVFAFFYPWLTSILKKK